MKKDAWELFRQLPLLILLVAGGLSGPSLAETSGVLPEAYSGLLQRHVHLSSEGTWVDYPGVARDPAFSQALLWLATTPPPAARQVAARTAYLLNAYNLLAIRMVVDNQPLASIRDAGNILWPVWKRPAGRVGGREMTLDELEHRQLRPLGDPRVHFALVCASRGCPDLRREPYGEDRLESQLDDQVRNFLADAGKGLRVTDRVIRVSRIFDWFQEDFASYGGVEAFIRHYRPDLPAGLPIRANLPYDWALNAPP